MTHACFWLRSGISRPRPEKKSRIISSRPVIDYRLFAEHLGDRFAGQIVLGRSDAARADDDVGVGQRPGDDFGDAVAVVADLGDEGDGDVEKGELLFEEGAVGIGDVAAEQLIADREDLRAHSVLPPTKRPARISERVWYPRRDSNPQPSDSKSDALSVELQGQAPAEF